MNPEKNLSMKAKFTVAALLLFVVTSCTLSRSDCPVTLQDLKRQAYWIAGCNLKDRFGIKIGCHLAADQSRQPEAPQWVLKHYLNLFTEKFPERLPSEKIKTGLPRANRLDAGHSRVVISDYDTGFSGITALIIFHKPEGKVIPSLNKIGSPDSRSYFSGFAIVHVSPRYTAIVRKAVLSDSLSGRSNDILLAHMIIFQPSFILTSLIVSSGTMQTLRISADCHRRNQRFIAYPGGIEPLLDSLLCKFIRSIISSHIRG